MRLSAVLLVAALGSALVAASPGGDDAKKMQGTWDIVEYELMAKPAPANALKKVKAIYRRCFYLNKDILRACHWI